MTNTVCGITYHVEDQKTRKVQGVLIKIGSPRFIVDGILHQGGKLPIRFKSLDRAERHIRNMKLEVK